jgi:hypothetical protein
MQPLSHRASLGAGIAAVGLVCALQGVNSFACYQHNVWQYLGSLLFIAIPMFPALTALKSEHPVRAVGGALLFAPWLAVAYYADCIEPYSGGGASMIYVAVVLWGLPTCFVGVLLSGPIARFFGLIRRPD